MKRYTTKRYTANETAQEGIYFNPRHLAFRSLEEPGVLPGRDGDTYFRVPALFLLLIGLPLSIAYVIFLPVIGFVMLFGAVAEKLSGKGRRRGEAAARRSETEVVRTLTVSFEDAGIRVESVPGLGGPAPSRSAA
ncbi:MAG TPA: hypothetical protein VGG06_26380 [Thermoanaerobaculia bacterium]|jgi:hypothetical protein